MWSLTLNGIINIKKCYAILTQPPILKELRFCVMKRVQYSIGHKICLKALFSLRAGEDDVLEFTEGCLFL